MSTERPSKTDSPYSVDTGKVQIETNLLGYTYNRDCKHANCSRTKIYEVGGFNNIRIGLTDNTDLQIVADVYLNKYEASTGGPATREQGFGDTTLRLKYNITGNHPSDKISVGLLPYIKLPTHRGNLGNQKIEFGIGAPFNVNLPNDYSIGGMSVINWINDESHRGYDMAYINSLVLSKQHSPKIKSYAEIFTHYINQSGGIWKNTFDAGLVYSISDNFSVDANLQFGISDDADDKKLFFGTAYRF